MYISTLPSCFDADFRTELYDNKLFVQLTGSKHVKTVSFLNVNPCRKTGKGKAVEFGVFSQFLKTAHCMAVHVSFRNCRNNLKSPLIAALT